ncbi:MAG TPA: hypothetical protein VFE84_09465, partial [Patescibacteria group bacterium]|nr:hypothetical protein [Patescibacteria group bacterium]
MTILHSRRHPACRAAGVAALVLCLGSAARAAEEGVAPDAGAVAQMQRQIDELRQQILALKEQVAALTRTAPAQTAVAQQTL